MDLCSFTMSLACAELLLRLIIWVVVGRDHHISSSSKPPQETTSLRRGDHRPDPVTMTKWNQHEKKLRLSTKQQSAFLEESFKEHNTLNLVRQTEAGTCKTT